jgi:hypothetical protein
MNRDELLRTLETLHEDLSQRTEVDDATRTALETLLADLQRIVSPAAPAAAPVSSDDSLGERLRAALAELELRHPTLTGTLSKFADRLSDMGI